MSRYRENSLSLSPEVKSPYSKESMGGRGGLLMRYLIGHCRNVRGVGKSMVVFHLFEELRYSKLNFRVLTTNRSFWRRKMEKWQLFKYHLKQRFCMDHGVDKPHNYGLYGILQLLQGSHLHNFPLKTLKLGQIAFHSLTFQLKCLDFQSNQYKKLDQVLSRFCNALLLPCTLESR